MKSGIHRYPPRIHDARKRMKDNMKGWIHYGLWTKLCGDLDRECGRSFAGARFGEGGSS
jgi:hypothetical protein